METKLILFQNSMRPRRTVKQSYGKFDSCRETFDFSRQGHVSYMSNHPSGSQKLMKTQLDGP